MADTQWAALEPLAEACRPQARVPPRCLWRAIGAIPRRHQNGAKWRALLGEHGPWWTAAQTFIRWSRLGVCERMLALAKERGVSLGAVFLDGTSIRAHPKAAGARKRPPAGPRPGGAEALGRSRGGYGTKACVVADASGRAVAFSPAPGQANEVRHATPLLARLPGVPG